MPKGFFTPDQLIEAGVGRNLIESSCSKCGLYKTVKSPKMSYIGQGKLKILVIGEAPGKTEDQQNEQWVGDAGELLRKRLKRRDISLNNDCWKINAINCRPTNEEGNNRTPTKSEIKYCKSFVDKAIADLKPEFIWLFGKSAIESVYLGRFSECDPARWRNLCIPDKKLNAYVLPMYHPSYILRAKGEPVRDAVFDRDLDFAISCLSKKPFEHINFFDCCHVLLKADEVINMLEIILEEKPEWFAFDYETTGLKPFRKGHKIACISGCDALDYSFSFPYQHDKHLWKKSEFDKIHDLWCNILIDPDIQKTSHGSKFETMWSRLILGVDPIELNWCSMNAAHVINTRSKFTGLKFQSFINFGVEPYEKSVESFLINTDINGFNKVMQAPFQELLLYNAMDSLMTFHLLQKQKSFFEEHPSLEKARLFTMEGIRTFADIEEVGINADKQYFSQAYIDEDAAIKNKTGKLNEYKEIKQFNESHSKPLDYESATDVRKLFFTQMGLKSKKMTAGGEQESVDKDVLDTIDHPIAKDIINLRKSLKTRNTYLAQFLREIEDDSRIHPMYNLNLARTIRSSSDHPNWQNIPIRDKIAKMITRSGIFPSKGNILLEWDYSAIEVRIAACYTKDPALINYINDPSTDMHRDQACRLFKLSKEEVTEDIRFFVKNGFVFPSFYGSYWKNTGKSLWDNVITSLKTTSGVRVMDHLYEKGILKRGKPFESFLEFVQSEEDIFWKKFKVFKQWQEKQIEKFVEQGYFDMYTGFREEGYLSKNNLINYRIQGTAFHCLLWSIIQINRHFAENEFITRIVGQIHDSCIYDAPPSEKKDVIDITEFYAIHEIRNAFPFINVPLALKWSITNTDQSWFFTKELKNE